MGNRGRDAAVTDHRVPALLVLHEGQLWHLALFSSSCLIWQVGTLSEQTRSWCERLAGPRPAKTVNPVGLA